MKKTTIKDIAKAAGVSIATVSYILNDVKTQSISDETRVKVLKIAQQLHYVTNRSARSLKLQKTGLIGILLFRDLAPQPWSDLKYVKTLYTLERLCGELGYHIIFMQVDGDSPSYDMIRERNLDGVFLLNADQERFATVSRYFGFGIPVFVIDSWIEDPIFHKILPDYAGSFKRAGTLLGAAPEYLVMQPCNDAELANRIALLSGLDESCIHRYEDRAGLDEFLNRFTDRKGLVINEFLANEVVRTRGDRDSIAVLCTSHSPDILPDHVVKLSYELNDYKPVVDTMDGNIQDADYSSHNKFIYLSVTS
ncbi:LacI family transcriptional regulator [Paenibacillus sp. J5C_2022]|uniref:LacI family DNA-binding transcriptional regulator n=1 Tax=Paenibacillus sp. J5C2022 TaxID=2977129 RepID=UPI0021D080FD|nr:LacI family DNA-binding transcriptional regulator [Paenibacillus sp. J5C2022]MCU6712893.1 LacI family transcriptional regulator [Paenibacillus sp. J5C2022]